MSEAVWWLILGFIGWFLISLAIVGVMLLVTSAWRRWRTPRTRVTT
jgi:uncharacterized SAM-binding protein YcdF (DUF218 family)